MKKQPAKAKKLSPRTIADLNKVVTESDLLAMFTATCSELIEAEKARWKQGIETARELTLSRLQPKAADDLGTTAEYVVQRLLADIEAVTVQAKPAKKQAAKAKKGKSAKTKPSKKK